MRVLKMGATEKWGKCSKTLEESKKGTTELS